MSSPSLLSSRLLTPNGLINTDHVHQQTSFKHDETITTLTTSTKGTMTVFNSIINIESAQSNNNISINDKLKIMLYLI